MTLWDIINSSIIFITSLFSTKLDYSSYIMSDSAVILLTTVYYKLQFTLDFVYFALLALYSSLFCSVSVVSFNALVIAFKFLVLIALLIFIRGGIPRYRFDHLTKVGWIKYLSLVLASMLLQFLLLWMC